MPKSDFNKVASQLEMRVKVNYFQIDIMKRKFDHAMTSFNSILKLCILPCENLINLVSK